MFYNMKMAIAFIVLVVLLAVVIPISIFSYNTPKKFPRGAMVSNGAPCAEIGMNIMKKYENAIDAMIAMMLCDGVTTMHNMGIGGGFVTTIYIKKEGKAYTMNAREVAPAGSMETMYHSNKTLSVAGGLAAAVPGELMGYWEMYSKFGGKAPWEELFQPTIELCKNGIPINRQVATNIETYKDVILKTKGLANLLKNDNGELVKENDTIKMLKLAETLTLIAKNGPSVLYNGSLSAPFISDIQTHGGIMTVEDLASYKVRWEDPVVVNLTQGLTLYSAPAPSSGPILGFIFKLLDGIIPSIDQATDAAIITEAFKFAYAARSHIGDPHFVNITEFLDHLQDQNFIDKTRKKLLVNQTSTDPTYYEAEYFIEDHGTANMVALAPNGDAIVTTSTINLIFGSKLLSQSTGIILNNEMDDFSSPGITNYFGVKPSTANFIKPGARPLSSMCPTIFVDNNGDVRLAVGGAGGTKITTSTVLVAIRNLWYNENIIKSVSAPRFHHQLFPMRWFYETRMPETIIDKMVELGHNITKQPSIQSCVTAISQINEVIIGSSDFRRLGNVSYYF